MSKQIIFKTFHIFLIPCNQFPIFFSSKVPEDSFWRFKCGKCCLYLTSMMLQYYFMCVLWQKPHNSEVSWIVPNGLIFHKHHCHTINSFEFFSFFPWKINLCPSILEEELCHFLLCVYLLLGNTLAYHFI